MKRIDTITEDQLPILDRKAKEWAEIGLATGPIDIERAKAGVAAAYQAADLTPPLYHVFLKSPYRGAIGVFVLKEIFAELAKMQSNASEYSPEKDTRTYDTTTVLHQVMDEVWLQLLPQFIANEGDAMPDSKLAYRAFRYNIHEIVDKSGMRWESSPIYGHHDAAWLAFYDTLGELGIPETVAPMRGMMEVAKTAGWWWPLTDSVVITQRPDQLHRDAEGRLHCENGPAISYADGWAFWAWHGVLVPQQVIEAPHTLTTDQIIKEANAEVKRVMLERYGFETFMQNTNAEKLDSSDFGTLWKADLGEGENGDDRYLVMVEVVCPSTDRKYMLRVPPTMTRAREAVAWTFDFDEPTYTPAIQT